MEKANMSIPNAGLSSTATSAAKDEAKSEIKSPEEPQVTGDENAFVVVAEMRRGLRGAMLIAATAVGLLLLGWLAFYFFIFMARGYVG
jgi:hypothetical protein